MKVVVVVASILFSLPVLACIDLSGSYELPFQEMKDYVDVKVFKQNQCNQIDIYNASIYVPDNLYMENPNPTSYKIDTQKHCDAFGFCYSAKFDNYIMQIVHTLKEFVKANGDVCLSNEVSFELDEKKSLLVIRKCSDGTQIKILHKRF